MKSDMGNRRSSRFSQLFRRTQPQDTTPPASTPTGEELLNIWKGDILACFTPKCSYCGIKSRKVVGQVAKGKYAQENNHLPRNWGYYCQRCYDEGMELEREAMYG